MKSKSLVWFLPFAFSTIGAAQFTPQELKGLDEALFIGNLTRSDLRYDRTMHGTNAPLLFCKQALRDPEEAASTLMSLHSLARDPRRALREAIRILPAGNGKPAPAEPQSMGTFPEQVPLPLRPALTSLGRAILQANAAIRKALEPLSQDERRELIESIPHLANPGTNLDFVRMKPIDRTIAIRLLDKVQLDKIYAASRDLFEAVLDAESQLRTLIVANPFEGQAAFEVGTLQCVLGGVGSNVHSDRGSSLTIDLGGDDVYTGRHGAGVGYAAVLIDFAGDDVYRGPDLNVGTGILGVGVAIDSAGHDTYRMRSLALGAGVAGVGVFLDREGDDDMRTDAMSIGFGCFGIGLLFDGSGDDRRTAKTWAMGAASAQGVGWMVDVEGDDTNTAFGTTSETATPVLGAGLGWESSASGGVGLATDFSGRDLYFSRVSSQSHGSNFGIGSLFDASGADMYTAGARSQAFGSESGGGLLFDLEGDDTYTVFGAGSQAQSISYGTAVLLDRSGNDLYASPRFRPGSAFEGGLSLFLESDGQDRYGDGPLVYSARIGNSLSVFVDLNGPDRYGDDLSDGQAGANSNGVAIDMGTHGSRSEFPTRRERPRAGSVPIKRPQELATLYQSAKGSGEDAEKAIDQLVGMGLPALEWMISNQLSQVESTEIAIFLELVQAIGQAGRDLIGLAIGDKRDAVAFGALQIALEGEILEGGAMIVQALSRPALTALAARAAGRLGARAAVPALLTLCASNDTALVRSALGSLSDLKDPTSVGTGQAMLESADLLVRREAIRLVSQFPASAVLSGKLFLRDANERKARIGCELLAAVGTAEALKELGEGLLDSRSGVRLQSAIGLAGRCPVDRRPAFMAVKQDPNPIVRMAAASLDPIR